MAIRTDCTIDRKAVQCPNASSIGYGKTTARVGDWVTFDEDGETRVGRMIGRIHYAPPIGSGDRAIRNWLCVAILNRELTHASERWVNPATVKQVHAPTPDLARFLAWFAGPDLLHRDPHRVRRMLDYGTAKGNQEPSESSWDLAERLKWFEEAEARQAQVRKKR